MQIRNKLYALQSGPIKPRTFVDISAMRADFCTKFTRLLNNKMHTLLQSFVKLYLKMTKLCSFNEDNPSISQRLERHADGCRRTLSCSLKLSRFVPAGLLHMGRHAARVK